MKTFYSKYKVLLYSFLGVIGFFLVWLISSLIVNSTLYPTPMVTFATLFGLLGQATTYQGVGMTILSLVISISVSFIVGTFFGVLGGVFEGFRAFFKPFITVLKAVPTAAVVFFLVVFTRPAMFASVIVTSIITFPVIYEAVVSGFMSIDQEILDTLDVDGANFFKRVFKIYIPLSYKHILLGMTQVIGLGMKLTIMSEILVFDNTMITLGSLIYLNYQYAYMPEIFAYSVIAIAIILLTDLGLYFAKKKLKKSITK